MTGCSAAPSVCHSYTGFGMHDPATSLPIILLVIAMVVTIRMLRKQWRVHG